MVRRLATIAAAGVGAGITGLLVAATIWPPINEVETGTTPEYPDLQPHYYSAEPTRVFDEARKAIESMARWELVEANSDARTLQATRETLVFGFVDDVTIRVESVTEHVTRVVLRSESRVGRWDFGQNARNIRQFLGALDRRLGAVRFDPDKLESS